MNKYIPYLVAVVLGVGGFFGGTQYQKSQPSGAVSQGGTRQFGQGGGGPGGQGGGSGRAGGAGGNRGGFVAGEVLSKDDKSLTIKLMDGGTKIVFIGASTKVNKSEAGTLTDVVVGKQVVVNGQSNPDGTVNAEIVQLGTPGGFGLGGRRGQPGASGSAGGGGGGTGTAPGGVPTGGSTGGTITQ